MSNFYDKASLVMIPSGTKEGTIFSLKPTNGDGDFTFSRSTAATRVNADGNVEKETMNLLFPSEGTTTGWSVSGVGINTSTILTGQQDPNGGTQGYRWTATCGATTSDRAWYRKNITAGGEVYTLSFWVKSATGSDQNVGFHFSGGTTTPLTATSSWQRVQYYGVAGVGSSYYGIEIRGTLTDQLADVYIYGMQLEFGLVARDYIETTTSAVYGGITDNIPRLDYTDSSCPSLLLEPQRSNLATDSEYFDGWVADGVSVTANSAISPDGKQNAYLLTAVSGTQRLYQTYTTSLVDYTMSIFVKEGTSPDLQITMANVAGGPVFTFSTESFSVVSGFTTKVESFNNGWYRLSVTKTSTSTSAGFQLKIPTSGTIYIYGAQFEAGSYATSYIPTYGSAVTRNVDVCGNAGNSDLFNDSEGVLYAEIETSSSDLNLNISLSDGTNIEYVKFIILSSSATIRAEIGYSGGNNPIAYYGYNYGDIIKMACVYSASEFKFFVNGSQQGSTITSPTLPSNLSSLQFDRGDGGANFYGNAKQVLYFPTALTDEELAALTTI